MTDLNREGLELAAAIINPRLEVGKADGLAVHLAELAIRAYLAHAKPDTAALVEALDRAHDRMATLDGVDNDDLCAIIDASAALSTAAGVPEGWQPIETAPKDGTQILLHGLVHLPSIDAGEETTAIGYWADINGGGWVWHGALSTVWTHWMPRPARPTSEGEA